MTFLEFVATLYYNTANCAGVGPF